MSLISKDNLQTLDTDCLGMPFIHILASPQFARMQGDYLGTPFFAHGAFDNTATPKVIKKSGFATIDLDYMGLPYNQFLAGYTDTNRELEYMGLPFTAYGNGCPPFWCNINGVWKQAILVSVNIGGIWKDLKMASSNINAVWKA